MFETAARLKLRFDSVGGQIATEDLYDLPLISANKASLDKIAVNINRQLRETATESFVVDTPKADTMLQLKMNIVKHVIAVKKEEAKWSSLTRHTKQDEALESTSPEDLHKAYASL